MRFEYRWDLWNRRVWQQISAMSGSNFTWFLLLIKRCAYYILYHSIWTITVVDLAVKAVEKVTLKINLYQSQKKASDGGKPLHCFFWYSFRYTSGFILGPHLFNIDICDLFLEKCETDITNCAIDNTPYVCSSDLDFVKSKLQKNTKVVVNDFITTTWYQMLERLT